ncbi:hypothetical protein GY45DRAFT_1376197 [Cubamyces sp. BRFM 1775]|nr:hypothetical protein GY45DRAFT_1376197 [Cubamyces sp. BRFM 1775]
MFEPDKPVTIIIKRTPFPAYLLASDEGRPLTSSSVILRHRHLRQQQRVLQVIPAGDTPAAKPTRGVSVPVEDDSSQPSSAGPSASTTPVDNPSAAPVAVPTHSSQRGLCAPLSTPTHANAQASSLNIASSVENTAAQSPSLAVDPPTCESTGKATNNGLHVVRHERGIRSRGEKTIWFASSSRHLLPTPPKLPLARVGDLYVHSCTDGAKQAWIFENAAWLSIDLGHPHPYLKGYRLNFCANGEPSWVTKDTIRTYRGRAKKRDGKSASGSPPGDA